MLIFETATKTTAKIKKQNQIARTLLQLSFISRVCIISSRGNAISLTIQIIAFIMFIVRRKEEKNVLF